MYKHQITYTRVPRCYYKALLVIDTITNIRKMCYKTYSNLNFELYLKL